MARENKQARHERRYGKAERLADLVISTPPERWLAGNLPKEETFTLIKRIQHDIESCPVINAFNVSEFFFLHERQDWTFKEDFPCSAPPFSLFFIESTVPPMVCMNGKLEARDQSAPNRFGFLFEAVDAAGKKFPKFERPGASECKLEEISGARWFYRALPILEFKDRPAYMSCLEFFAVDSTGRILEDPSFLQSGVNLPRDVLSLLHEQVLQFFMPCLLAISFMNCKNCILEAVEPNLHINRLRERGGLKPFVRYHTINIEPMKKVLRTEGQSETEGLKRALHICRGHFSTYSEEKPLFGKVAGTFWIPAHVRGEIKQGVVISDFKVNPPVQIREQEVDL